ncbi:MAG: hypothetical protein U5P41_08980 [Gammaproteobacteria bacterium]|nr:hypothetical protein [Gammaproteobacteria bacterium]
MKYVNDLYGTRNCVITILELGSGPSTIQLAEDYPKANIYSLENDTNILSQNNNKLLQSEQENATVLYAPIKTKLILGGVFQTYTLKNIPKDISFDVIIIDGPVERLYPFGREAALYQLFDRLSVGCIIGLDDCHRKSAKGAVKHWKVMYGDAIDIIEETESFIVLKKCHDSPPLSIFVPEIYNSYISCFVSKVGLSDSNATVR